MDSRRNKTFSKALLGLVWLAAVLALVLFAAAGTTRYPQAWAFLSVFYISSVAITLYLMKNDPELLERRMRAGPFAETDRRQKVITAFATPGFLTMLVVPGLDRRFSWSHVPVAIVALGNVLVALGFVLIFLVFKQNRFASATVGVEADQKLIDTGLYAYVRHPMYVGGLILLAGMPLALGSWWGLGGMIPMVLVIVWRLLVEEEYLSSHLPGYTSYCAKTRYRLIPHVW